MVCEGVEKRCHLYWKKVMPILFCKVKNLVFVQYVHYLNLVKTLFLTYSRVLTQDVVLELNFYIVRFAQCIKKKSCMDGASHKGWLLFLLCLKTRVPPLPHTQKKFSRIAKTEKKICYLLAQLQLTPRFHNTFSLDIIF